MPGPKSNKRALLESDFNNPAVQDYLAGLRFTETGDTTFNPNIVNTQSGTRGPYQFKTSTRNQVKKNWDVDAFSNDSKEAHLAALGLMRDISPQALDQIKKGNYEIADRAFNKTWTSLPGGREKNVNTAELNKYRPSPFKSRDVKGYEHEINVISVPTYSYDGYKKGGHVRRKRKYYGPRPDYMNTNPSGMTTGPITQRSIGNTLGGGYMQFNDGGETFYDRGPLLQQDVNIYALKHKPDPYQISRGAAHGITGTPGLEIGYGKRFGKSYLNPYGEVAGGMYYNMGETPDNAGFTGASARVGIDPVFERRVTEYRGEATPDFTTGEESSKSFKKINRKDYWSFNPNLTAGATYSHNLGLVGDARGELTPFISPGMKVAYNYPGQDGNKYVGLFGRGAYSPGSAPKYETGIEAGGDILPIDTKFSVYAGVRPDFSAGSFNMAPTFGGTARYFFNGGEGPSSRRSVYNKRSKKGDGGETNPSSNKTYEDNPYAAMAPWYGDYTDALQKYANEDGTINEANVKRAAIKASILNPRTAFKKRTHLSQYDPRYDNESLENPAINPYFERELPKYSGKIQYYPTDYAVPTERDQKRYQRYLERREKRQAEETAQAIEDAKPEYKEPPSFWWPKTKRAIRGFGRDVVNTLEKCLPGEECFGYRKQGGWVYPTNTGYPKYGKGGKFKRPSIIYQEDAGAYYDPLAQNIYIDPELARDKNILQHEFLHHAQNLAGNLQRPELYQGPLNRPQTPSADIEQQSLYYNRRPSEQEEITNRFLSHNPTFNLVNPNLVYDKAINPKMYQIPTTAEGEARAYEDSLRAGLTKRRYAQGGVTFSAGGENHRVYIKESPTGLGKGVEGHVMVNHPTTDKGKWDTIDLTEKAGAKTVAQGVAATKKWHRENPEYADGGAVTWSIVEDRPKAEHGLLVPPAGMFDTGVQRSDNTRTNIPLQVANLEQAKQFQSDLKNPRVTEEKFKQKHGISREQYRNRPSNFDVGMNQVWQASKEPFKFIGADPDLIRENPAVGVPQVLTGALMMELPVGEMYQASKAGLKALGKTLGTEEGLLSNMSREVKPVEVSRTTINLKKTASNPKVRKAPLWKDSENITENLQFERAGRGVTEENKFQNRVIARVNSKNNPSQNIELKGATLDDGQQVYYFSANLHNPLEAGRAFKRLEQEIPKGSLIYEPSSLSLDSFKSLLKRTQDSNKFKVYPSQHVPLNTAGIHNKFPADVKLITKVEDYPNIAYFETREEAAKVADEINSNLPNNLRAVKARIKQTDYKGTPAFIVEVPNFKLEKLYKKGGWTGYPDHTMYSSGMDQFDQVRRLTKYDDGGITSPVTSADSAVLYNNTMDLLRYYGDQKKYKDIGSGSTYDTNVTSQNIDAVKGMAQRLTNPKQHPFTARRWNSNLNTTTNLIKGLFGVGTMETDALDPDYEFKMSDYYQKLNPYQYKMRELANSIIDTEAPMALYDTRIKPTVAYEYQNVDNRRGPIAGTNPLLGDIVNFYGYDPELIKPWSMLTPQEKLKRQKIAQKIIPAKSNNIVNSTSAIIKPPQNIQKPKINSTKLNSTITKVTKKTVPAIISQPKPEYTITHSAELMGPPNLELPKTVEYIWTPWGKMSAEEYTRQFPGAAKKDLAPRQKQSKGGSVTWQIID